MILRREMGVIKQPRVPGNVHKLSCRVFLGLHITNDTLAADMQFLNHASNAGVTEGAKYEMSPATDSGGTVATLHAWQKEGDEPLAWGWMQWR